MLEDDGKHSPLCSYITHSGLLYCLIGFTWYSKYCIENIIHIFYCVFHVHQIEKGSQKLKCGRIYRHILSQNLGKNQRLVNVKLEILSLIQGLIICKFMQACSSEFPCLSLIAANEDNL